jgi:hypothetical protein
LENPAALGQHFIRTRLGILITHAAKLGEISWLGGSVFGILHSFEHATDEMRAEKPNRPTNLSNSVLLPSQIREGPFVYREGGGLNNDFENLRVLFFLSACSRSSPTTFCQRPKGSSRGW